MLWDLLCQKTQEYEYEFAKFAETLPSYINFYSALVIMLQGNPFEHISATQITLYRFLVWI